MYSSKKKTFKEELDEAAIEIRKSMGQRYISTTCYITVDQQAKLRVISKKVGVPASELIRDGINAVIRGYEDEES